MPRILVAVDDSDASERVGDFVNEFFAGRDTDVLAINVAPPGATVIPPPLPYAWISPWWYQDDSTVAAQLKERAIARGTRTIAEAEIQEDDATVTFGDPVESILEAAEARNVDVIVVGSNHKNLVERVLKGSVSRGVVKEANRPVLVVP
jgi:nucleotide-binding universal stress UspA family protein